MSDTRFTSARARRDPANPRFARRSRVAWRALLVASFATAAAASNATDVPAVAGAAGDDASTATDPPSTAPASLRAHGADGRRTTTSTAALPLDLSPHALRKAIAGSRDPADDVRSSGAAFGAGSRPASQVDRAFRDAEIPSCVNGTALRFEPTTIGPVALGGLFVLPLWIHAIATGRCR